LTALSYRDGGTAASVRSRESAVEGNNSFFATYYAVISPGATASTVRFRYLHENGLTCSQGSIPASGRRLAPGGQSR